jgi:hypothetical protein
LILICAYITGIAGDSAGFRAVFASRAISTLVCVLLKTSRTAGWHIHDQLISSFFYGVLACVDSEAIPRQIRSAIKSRKVLQKESEIRRGSVLGEVDEGVLAAHVICGLVVA